MWYSYAYFSLEIDGKPKEITMSTGDLRLIYKDDTELKLVDAWWFSIKSNHS